MILDAAVEAKLETRILEEWYCRDENAVPPAYYLRPKSEMLKSYQNTVSHSHLLTKVFSIRYSGRQSPRPGTCCCLWIRVYSPVHTWTTASVVLLACTRCRSTCKLQGAQLLHWGTLWLLREVNLGHLWPVRAGGTVVQISFHWCCNMENSGSSALLCIC